ncbi:MAG: Ferric iron ABC transporter, permease protein, partial [uncultured Rubrobacteraceae bacterium]
DGPAEGGREGEGCEAAPAREASAGARDRTGRARCGGDGAAARLPRPPGLGGGACGDLGGRLRRLLPGGARPQRAARRRGHGGGGGYRRPARLADGAHRPAGAEGVGGPRRAAARRAFLCGWLRAREHAGPEGPVAGQPRAARRGASALHLWPAGGGVGALVVHLSLRVPYGTGRAEGDGSLLRGGGSFARERAMGDVLSYYAAAASAGDRGGGPARRALRPERLWGGLAAPLRHVLGRDLHPVQVRFRPHPGRHPRPHARRARRRGARGRAPDARTGELRGQGVGVGPARPARALALAGAVVLRRRRLARARPARGRPRVLARPGDRGGRDAGAGVGERVELRLRLRPRGGGRRARGAAGGRPRGAVPRQDLRFRRASLVRGVRPAGGGPRPRPRLLRLELRPGAVPDAGAPRLRLRRSFPAAGSGGHPRRAPAIPPERRGGGTVSRPGALGGTRDDHRAARPFGARGGGGASLPDDDEGASGYAVARAHRVRHARDRGVERDLGGVLRAGGRSCAPPDPDLGPAALPADDPGPGEV